MLVLTRRIEESIMVDDTEVKVIKVTGKTVKLGITGPRSTAVHRKEVYDAINAKKMDFET